MKVRGILISLMFLALCGEGFSQEISSAVNGRPVPAEIMNAKISLIDAKGPITLKDFGVKPVVILLLEGWCGPCKMQADDLEQFYTYAREYDIEIVGLSSETSQKEKRDFRYFARRHGYHFKFGWIDREVFKSFSEYSRFRVIPQVYLISDGKFQGQFQGGGFKKMAELRIAIIDNWILTLQK